MGEREKGKGEGKGWNGVGRSWENGKFGREKERSERPSGGEDSPSQVRAYRAIVTAPHRT